jgi:putative aldouronate transport system substrate-binding protein
MREKVFIVVLAVLIAAGVWAGGQQGRTQTGSSVNRANFNTLGTYPLVKNKENITVMMPTSELDQNMDANWMTLFYEDKTNVHVNWILAPGGELKTRVNLALASQDQIDLILTGATAVSQLTLTEILRLVDQQLITPIETFIESDTINIKANLAKVKGWREIITLPDGHIYTVPRLNECLHCAYYGKMWVNMEFLKNVNMNIPTSPAEFKQMLVAFRDKDANGNGDPTDEIPFSGSVYGYSSKVDTYLMSAFVYDDGLNRLYVNKGRVTAAFQQPEFQEGLHYLRDLYAENLIYPGTFTQDRDTQYKLNSQKYESIIGAIPYEHHGNMGSREKGEPVRWIEYKPIPPLKGPHGLQVARYEHYQQFETNRAVFIPSTSKNPALVMRWLDWFHTEEGPNVLYRGGKGIGWTDADPGATSVDGGPAKYKTIILQPTDQWYTNRNWGQIFPNMRTAAYRAAEQTPFDYLVPDGSGVERALHVYTLENYVPYGQAPENQIPPLYYSGNAASEVALLQTNINTYVEESIAKFVTGAMDTSRDWANFQNNLKSLNIDRYLQIIQNAYDNSAFAKK